MLRRIRTLFREEQAQSDLEETSVGSALAVPERRVPVVTRAVARVLPERHRDHWLDVTSRNVFFAKCSIGTSLTMAAWKIVVAVLATASLFWIINAAFSIGLAAARYMTVSTHRSSRRPAPRIPRTAEQRERRMYRTTGAVILGLSIVYMVSCATMLFGDAHIERYDTIVGITIAALAFTELGLAIHGAITTRNNTNLIVGAIKLSNLASALVLIVLTQSALTSFSDGEGASLSHATGLGGILFGGLAGAIGVYMLVRRLPTAPQRTGEELPELETGL